MYKKTLLLAPLFLAILTGCGSTESYTADFLYENSDIRTQVLEDCKINKQSDSNCKNANDAEAKAKAEEWKKKAFR